MHFSDEEKQKNGTGMFETNVVVVGQIPKNASTEQRFTFKHVAGGHRGAPTPYLDLREYWFRNGPAEEPVPTSKGIMIKVEQLPDVLVMILSGMQDNSIDSLATERLRDLLDRKGTR